MLVGAVSVGQDNVDRMFGRQERHHVRSRHGAAEIADEMPQVVFLLQPDGAVGQKHERLVARQAADRVIRIDPRVHAFRGLQFRAGRTQFRGNDRRLSLQGLQQGGQVQTIVT
jgi:hypothetical protein